MADEQKPKAKKREELENLDPNREKAQDLTEGEAETATGGGLATTTALPSSHVDDGPTEEITFVYGKLGVKYTQQTGEGAPSK